MSHIRMRGLRAGNLRNLNLELEHGRWTAVHGPSGAGKSALLFRTLEPVARQRFAVLEDPTALPGQGEAWLHHVADRIDGLQPVVAAAGEVPRGRRATEVGTALDLWPLLVHAYRQRGHRRCSECGQEWAPWTAAGLEERLRRSGEGSAIWLFTAVGGAARDSLLAAGWTRVRLGASGLTRLEECPERLPPSAWLLLDRLRWRSEQGRRLRDACAEASRRQTTVLIEVDGVCDLLPAPGVCPHCAHSLPERPDDSLFRLREVEDLVIDGRTWADWCTAPLVDWLSLHGSGRAARRLACLERTRLGHLSATRTLGTLSLGEGRRLELVALLSQVRCGQLALFDEPGMGLHGSERRALAELLQELVAQGNTVVTADPAREFLEAADHWLMLGPGGGQEGGRVVGRGPRDALPAEPTWQPRPARSPEQWLEFRDLRSRFLDISQLRLPLGRLTALAGVSGSGKTTLLEEELVPRLRSGEKYVGDAPIGGVTVLLERALGSSAFSTVATLSGVWAEVRRAFAEGEEGRIRGLSPSDLVARRNRGGCPRCAGHGVEERALPCAQCEGLGLREDLLSLRLRNRSLRQWLTTPLQDLEKRLPSSGRLRKAVSHLIALGLGARTLGERGRHLSLGERSRLALARALAVARADRPRLFLLDEPCLGLPFPEARRVVDLLQALCDQGHGFWVVEHHEVLLRSADWVVELGPGAGPAGGRLLYQGDPAGWAEQDTPTGHWFRARSEQTLRPTAQVKRPPLHSEAVAESLARQGRQGLEQDLLRELSTRSPLLQDLVGGGQDLIQDEAEVLPPTAWPTAPPADATLLEVLGLQRALHEAIAALGEGGCAACGGRGPWASLADALAAATASATLPEEVRHAFTCPLPTAAIRSGSELLLAAGFRRVLRAGSRSPLRRGAELVAADEVWLDEFDFASGADPGRLQDLEHHAKLLGEGVLHARAVDHLDRPPVFRWQAGACRDCGRVDAGQALRLDGLLLAEWQALPVTESSARLADRRPLFAHCAPWIAASGVGERAGTCRWRHLTDLEARIARLLGWLMQPLEGLVLLWDQPLAAMPPPLAERIAAALTALPPGCAFRFTDAESWLGPAEARAPLEEAIGEAQPFAPAFNLAGFADPPMAAECATLRQALALDEPLRQHFLRTEGALLGGWTPAALGSGAAARSCSNCRGRGGVALHPELRLPCPACQGSGWSRETAVLEDRGLRWPDLGATTLATLAEHFSGVPALAKTLRLTVDMGWGELLLDEELRRLPRGFRALAPLVADLAAGRELSEQCWAAPAAGLNRLELERMRSTIVVFASLNMTSITSNWRDHHPALHG